MEQLMLSHKSLTIQGKVSVGQSTKQLLRKIGPRRIAVILHEDIDEMAAYGLIEAEVKAIINAAPTMSGNYHVTGPTLLLRSGIPILDIAPHYFTYFHDDMDVCVRESTIELIDYIIPSIPFTEERWTTLTEQAQQNMAMQLSRFIDNTLHYARLEKDVVLQPLTLPHIETTIKNKHVVVVVRGCGYKNDLLALADYIADYDPVLIGVDGGADALVECGYKPDIIIGDMDSITDETLASGSENIVHAFLDGRAPGMERIKSLGLDAVTIRAKGISEDVALLLAYEKKAQLIVTVGSHTHMNDFLAKGRKGMGSTLLVRMKVGSKLIDAKGMSTLYQRRLNVKSVKEGNYALNGLYHYPSME